MALIVDDFEDSDLDEYVVATGSNGSTGYTFDTTTTYNGTVSYRVNTGSWRNFISHPNGTPTPLPNYPSRGDTFRWYTYCAGTSTGTRVQFAVQDTNTRDNCYSSRIAPRDNDIQIRVRSGGSELLTIGDANITIPTNVWLEMEIVWGVDASGNSTFDVTVTNISNNTTLTAFSGTDTTGANYTAGGIGLGTWGSATTAKHIDYIHIEETGPEPQTVTVPPENLTLSEPQSRISAGPASVRVAPETLSLTGESVALYPRGPYGTQQVGTTYYGTGESPPRIAGTVTLGGVPQSGVTVLIIDSATDAVVAEVVTDANGEFSYLPSVPGPFHIATEHDSGTTQYNAESYPGIQ